MHVLLSKAVRVRALIAVAAAVGLTVLVSPFAVAETLPEPMGRSVAAAKVILGQIQEAQRTGVALPKLSDAKFGVFLRQAWDADAVVRGRPYAAKDVPLLLDWLDLVKPITAHYVYYKAQPGNQVQLDDNAKTYGDEIAMAAVFNWRLTVSMEPPMSEFMSSLPKDDPTLSVREDGRKQARLGMAQMALGMLQMLEPKAEDHPASRMLSAALLDDIATVAGVFTSSHRDVLAATAANRLSDVKDPVVVGNLKSIISELSPKMPQ
jgi:hypothetical protein